MGGDQSKAITPRGDDNDSRDNSKGRRRSSSAKQPPNASRTPPNSLAPQKSKDVAIVAHPPLSEPPELKHRLSSFDELAEKSPPKEFEAPDSVQSDTEEFDSPRRRSVVALHTLAEIEKIEKDLAGRSPPPAPLPPQSSDSSHGAMFHKEMLQLPEPDEIRKMSLQEMVDEGRRLSMNQPRAASLPVINKKHKHDHDHAEQHPAPPSDPKHAPNPHARRLQDSNGLVEVHHQQEMVLSDEEHLASIHAGVAEQQLADEDLPSVIVADETRPTCAPHPPAINAGPEIGEEGGAHEGEMGDPELKDSSPLQSLAEAMGNKRTFSVHSIDHQIPGIDPGLQIAAAELAEDIKKEKKRIIQETKEANPLGADGSPDEWEEEDYRRGSAVLAFLHNKHHHQGGSTPSVNLLPVVEHLSVATLKPPPPIPREHHHHHHSAKGTLHTKGSAGNISTNSSQASPSAAPGTTDHLMAVPMDKTHFNSTSKLEISATECDEKARGQRSGSSGVLMPSGTFAAVQRQSSETYDREALDDVA